MAEFSEWDSQVFGCRVGTHRYTDLPRDIGSTEGLDLVFARGPYRGQLPDPRSTVFEVQVDLRCESRVRLAGSLPRANDRDLPDVFRIADATLIGHRWGCDPRLAPYAKRFYRTWLTSAHAREQVYVLPTEHGCAGFVVIEESDQGCRLSLIAVDPSLQRRGYGERLVQFFLARDSLCWVKTWVTNVAALNLYFQNGFKVDSIECVEHVWIQ